MPRQPVVDRPGADPGPAWALLLASVREALAADDGGHVLRGHAMQVQVYFAEALEVW